MNLLRILLYEFLDHAGSSQHSCGADSKACSSFQEVFCDWGVAYLSAAWIAVSLSFSLRGYAAFNNSGNWLSICFTFPRSPWLAMTNSRN